MKPITEEMLQEHQNASIRGALEGFVAGSAFTGAGHWYLNRTWQSYRVLPVQLKLLGAICIVLPTLTLQGERRGVEYDQSNWVDERGATLLTENEDVIAQRWAELSTSERLADFASRHEYSLILGAWASSLAISGAIINRNKYQTFAQKIVQARMWAQGLTVGILIVAGALHGAKRRNAVQTVDHSWQHILQEDEMRKAKLAQS
ncbi:hypothetical protein BDV98DRAFT_560710 [Pterulicium gracile]|uniref:HIG1 domain-containing protein n=1 Tax=Pterulicium gracile TaxID=1884261 RepID=A0A5C3QWS2_9AGAR|nr:hypothetical protein BDV98DRAFT_560710 [Pterula gracilis]